MDGSLIVDREGVMPQAPHYQEGWSETVLKVRAQPLSYSNPDLHYWEDLVHSLSTSHILKSSLASLSSVLNVLVPPCILLFTLQKQP